MVLSRKFILRNKMETKNPEPEQFNPISWKFIGGGKVEMYGSEYYRGGLNNPFYSFHLFPREKGVLVELEKKRPIAERFDDKRNLLGICNSETREVICFHRNAGITQEFSADYNGFPDKDGTFWPTETRPQATYLRNILSYLLPRFRRQLESKKYTLDGMIVDESYKNILELKATIDSLNQVLVVN